MEQSIKKIFVTVGHRVSNIPMQNKVGFWIFEDDSMTEIQIAKKFRKQCAENPSSLGHYVKEQKPFKPSDLYWAIFDSLDDEKPRLKSNNYHPGIIVSVYSFMVVQ